MKLSSNATSQTELLEDIVTLILHRAKQQRSLAHLCKPMSPAAEQRNTAADTLRALAEDVKNMELAGVVYA